MSCSPSSTRKPVSLPHDLPSQPSTSSFQTFSVCCLYLFELMSKVRLIPFSPPTSHLLPPPFTLLPGPGSEHHPIRTSRPPLSLFWASKSAQGGYTLQEAPPHSVPGFLSRQILSFSKMNLVGQKDQSSPFTNSLEDDRLGPASEDHYIATSSICTPFEHLQFHLDMTNAQYLMPSTHQQPKRLRVHGLTLPDTAACVSGPHTAAYSPPELVPFTVRSNVPFSLLHSLTGRAGFGHFFIQLPSHRRHNPSNTNLWL